MGYMGFGMQKWIYTKRPRKPFSARRRTSFSQIPTYKRAFNVEPSKSKRDLFFTILSFCTAFFLLTIIIPRWVGYENEHKYSIKEIRKSKTNREFQFLMTSGIKRFRQNNFIGAYSEFKLAHKIYPKNTDTIRLLEETLMILCFEEESHCKELDDFLVR